jgi:hypothetical protein
VDLTAGVAAALAAAGEAFGPPPAAPPQPRWGALYVELDAGADEAFATAIELIYEGYLLHYRESRALALTAADLETRLLAGDCFYALGLRGIAASGDADAVGLLARLMASCSYLRTAGAPFAADDALWAYTTAGLVAQHAGAGAASVAALFDEVEAGFHRAPPADVAAAVGRAAPRLDLPDPAPLLRELEAVAGR